MKSYEILKHLLGCMNSIIATARVFFFLN